MGSNTAQILLTYENPLGDLIIKNLKMATYVAFIHFFAPLLNPLENIATKVDNTAAEGWAKSGSVSSSTAAGPLLRKMACINLHTITHSSVSRISRADNKEADSVSHLTHLPISSFLQNFNSSFPQPNHSRLRLLPYAVTHHMYTMLHTKRSPQVSPITPSGNTTQHRGSSNPNVPGFASPSTSRESIIQSLSLKYFLNTSDM